VTITDPQHPLCGQQFPLARTTASCPAAAVTIVLPGGYHRRVPRAAVALADAPDPPAPCSPSLDWWQRSAKSLRRVAMQRRIPPVELPPQYPPGVCSLPPLWPHLPDDHQRQLAQLVAEILRRRWPTRPSEEEPADE